MNPIDRRSMLKASVVTSVAAAISAGPLATETLAAKPAGPSDMQFGLVTYLWGKDMDLPTLIDVCEKSGLNGVELRTEHKHGVEPSLNKAEREDVKKRFADSPVELVGYGSNAQYHEADPKKLQANIELTKRYVELMHDCGASGVKVKPNGLVKGVPHEQTIEQIGKALNDVAAFGADFGQQIRVEVHGKETQEIDVMKAIFDVADHPNATICWNSNDEDLKGPGLEKNFELLKGRFGDTVHVRELNIGDYPYAKLMRLFRQMNYQGWILLEARTDPKDKIAALIEQRKVFEEMVAG
ncbi:sugar phosphate isomerase/epimerase family protein [Stieleria varia]|uniref:Xylose isomerase-like TIM barrel n=1 Tax=Stieleria varia TaxID=2528005 RepID=A0A5C6BA04_9BACT|nr:TIM barrel protein [Stieleria varia]TWU08462.1 Xylose isomerase-like TIM barrel [Stieleria varia]